MTNKKILFFYIVFFSPLIHGSSIENKETEERNRIFTDQELDYNQILKQKNNILQLLKLRTIISVDNVNQPLHNHEEFENCHQNPLEYAIQLSSNDEISFNTIQYLLARGARPSTFRNCGYPLTHALESQQYKIALLLIQYYSAIQPWHISITMSNDNVPLRTEVLQIIDATKLPFLDLNDYKPSTDQDVGRMILAYRIFLRHRGHQALRDLFFTQQEIPDQAANVRTIFYKGIKVFKSDCFIPLIRFLALTPHDKIVTCQCHAELIIQDTSCKKCGTEPKIMPTPAHVMIKRQQILDLYQKAMEQYKSRHAFFK